MALVHEQFFVQTNVYIYIYKSLDIDVYIYIYIYKSLDIDVYIYIHRVFVHIYTQTTLAYT